MRVEVAYARPDAQLIVSVEVGEGCTLERAIARSGLLQRFPEIDLKIHRVGVFGKPRALTDVLRDGDRVEVYRDLSADPKQLRRRRAARRSR